MMLPIRFCSQCGTPTSLKVPPGDDVPRAVCEACEHIHYQNPNIVLGTIPVWKNQILFCRRAIEPGYGLWTLPGGFMENGETVEQGARRETLEECGADVEITSLYAVYSIPHINQVYMMFRANMRDPTCSRGDESLKVALFRYHDIPWDELAFRVIRATMKRFVNDFVQGSFSVHVEQFSPRLTGRRRPARFDPRQFR